jgi:hypothetical protein
MWSSSTFGFEGKVTTADSDAEVNAPESIVEALRTFGDWKVRWLRDQVWMAELDGMQLRLQVIDKIAVISPVSPSRNGKLTVMDDWHDIHHGNVPTPTRFNYQRSPDRIVARLQAGFMPQVVNFLRVLIDVDRAEQARFAGAQALVRIMEIHGGRVIAGELARGQSVIVRLSGPYAGEVEVRPDATVSIRFQEVPIEYARKLFDRISEDLSSDQPSSIRPTISEPEKRRRGPLPGDTLREGGAGERVTIHPPPFGDGKSLLFNGDSRYKRFEENTLIRPF